MVDGWLGYALFATGTGVQVSHNALLHKHDLGYAEASNAPPCIDTFFSACLTAVCPLQGLRKCLLYIHQSSR